MRVLLTRPSADAERTRARLEAQGHDVLVSPVIDVFPTGAGWPGGTVDALVATSAQAFTTMPAAWGPTAEARRLMPLWLVGGRTEAAARARGFAGAATVTSNAVALAFEMGKRRLPDSRRVYLAGRDRKPDIETALDVTGQPVEVVELYDARAVDRLADETVDALAAGALDAVLHYSARSARLFLDLARKAGLEVGPAMHICLSEDVAAALEGGGHRILVAAAPNEAALLDAVASADQA